MTTSDWLEAVAVLLFVAAAVFSVWFASGVLGAVVERWKR